MSRVQNFVYAIAFIGIASMPSAVKADSISKTFTVPTFTVTAAQNFNSAVTFLPGFDPALGTLDSARVEFIFTTSFINAASGTNNSGSITYHLDNGDAPGGGIATLDSNDYAVSGFVGEAPITTEEDQTYTSLGDLAAFITNGDVGMVVSGQNGNHTTGISLTFPQAESVTYTFTPAVASAPEPVSFALFGGGLVVAGLIGRRAARSGN